MKREIVFFDGRHFESRNKANSIEKIRISIELCQAIKTKKDYVTLEDVKNPWKLGISGDIFIYNIGHNASGQVNDIINKVCANMGNELKFIMFLWNNYHLNTMKPGTLAQKKALVNTDMSYEEESDFLASKNLLYDRGYLYGSEWLIKQIPKYILHYVKDYIQTGTLPNMYKKIPTEEVELIQKAMNSKGINIVYKPVGNDVEILYINAKHKKELPFRYTYGYPTVYKISDTQLEVTTDYGLTAIVTIGDRWGNELFAEVVNACRKARDRLHQINKEKRKSETKIITI